MYYRQPTASRESVVRRVMRFPASLHSSADSNGDSGIKVSADSESSVTVSHPASNGTDSLLTSPPKCTDTQTVNVTPSTVVHNGTVTLPISQDKVNDTLTRSAVVPSSVSTTASRQ